MVTSPYKMTKLFLAWGEAYAPTKESRQSSSTLAISY